MKKTNIILVIIIIILLIALAIMTKLYLDMRKSSKLGLESTLENANLLFEANKEIDILEKELESYKNANITTTITNTVANTVNNTSNTNTTEPYIPEGMKVADTNDNSGIKASDIVFNTKAENVTIEILKDTITNTSVEILITDNNEDQYCWGKSYRIQKKENGKWNDLKTIQDLGFEEIAYKLDENNQLKQKINWERFYGELEKGTYRIVKTQWSNNEYIDLYSNEFEIK